MQKSRLLAELATCLSVDRGRLLQRWHRARQLPPEQRQAALAQVQEQVSQSQAAVQQRQQRLPAVPLNADLPVSGMAAQIVEAIRTHQVVVIAGETGSGKTTQLPKLCLLAGRGLTGWIGHTQPRRLAARTVAARIAEELGQPLGEAVGFKVRFSESSSPDGYIKLMTDGILLAELSGDRDLRAYDTLIIDEAHERSLNIDFLLGYLRQLLQRRPDLKVVITSATLDVQRFSRHFGNAPVIEVAGRTYPVEVVYRPMSTEAVASDEDEAFAELEDNLPRAVVAAVEECVEDARRKSKAGQGDILIFASTEREIRELAEVLRRHGPPHTEILPLYARLSLAEQQKVFHPSGKGRRIVIATNVAETSLTVPNIHYVIDPGFARISRYSYRSRVQRLPIEAVARAAADQRKGRCGRVAPGVCIRLYSEEDYLGRPEFTEPEIRRTHLAAVILQMQALGLGEVADFPFIEPPDGRFINDGFRLLEELGAVDNQRRLTALGRQLGRFPLDPRLARMLIAGAHSNCLDEVLMIVSALSVQDPRERPPEKQTQADQKHALFREPDSDFLFFVKLWRSFEAVRGDLSENQRRQWAKTHFLSYLRLREWRETHHQLLLLCKELGLNRNVEPASYEQLHRALLSGLLAQVAQKNDERDYTVARGQKAKVFPASILHRKGPPWVMAAEVVETSQVYLRTLAKIEPEWIEQEGKHLLKHHVYEPHWEKSQGRVVAYEQLSLFGLIVNPRRKLNYETVNPEEAHQIFVRSALVEGDINLKAPFFRHNRQLVEEIGYIEDKVRRRDLLVDEEVLFRFYCERIPATVANARNFDGWRHEAERQRADILFLRAEDLLAQDELPDLSAYPEQWSMGGLTLPLSYHFDPTADNDGVTLTLPQVALAQVSEAALSWLVPGLLGDKIEALLKALPKAVRRQLVPVPDTARSLLATLDPTARERGEALTDVLGKLLRARGVQISSADWQDSLSQLPDYCHFYLRVVDERGKLLEAGRHLDQLRLSLGRQVSKAAPVVVSDDVLTVFPEQMAAVVERKVAGVLVRSHAALVPTTDGKGVVLRHFDNERQAHQQQVQGQRWLLLQACATEQKQLRRQLPARLVLDFAVYGNKARLEELVVNAVFAAVFADEVVYSRENFVRLSDNKRGALLTDGHKLCQTIAEIYRLWQEVMAQLRTFSQPVFAAAVADIQTQLQHLQPASFLEQVAYRYWSEYPRYLKALQLRLQRLPNNITRDSQAIQEVERRWQTLVQKKEALLARGQDLQAAEDYRWLLEEYRISLFAQPMKTAQPVSAARLDRWWTQH